MLRRAGEDLWSSAPRVLYDGGTAGDGSIFQTFGFTFFPAECLFISSLLHLSFLRLLEREWTNISRVILCVPNVWEVILVGKCASCSAAAFWVCTLLSRSSPRQALRYAVISCSESCFRIWLTFHDRVISRFLHHFRYLRTIIKSPRLPKLPSG
jgi:hypothetical protein